MNIHSAPKTLLIVATRLALLALPCVAAAAEIDACALVSKAEAAKLLGELREEPKPETGIQKEKQCNYTTVAGAWLKVSIYSSDRWGMQKGIVSEMNPTDLPGVGEEAFTVKRGTTYEIYVRKGKWILELSSSAGPEPTKQFAQTAAERMSKD